MEKPPSQVARHPAPRARSRSLGRWAGLASALGLGVALGAVLAARPLQASRFDPYRKLGIFTKVLAYIESHYVENVSEEDLMYGAARGLTDVLDPHTRFMDPVEYERLRRETEGDTEIEGIGIDLERRKRGLVVVSPIEGSPAFRAGVLPGDVIRRIDGADAAELGWDEAVARIQGRPGTEVELVVERVVEGRSERHTLRIRREKFEVKTVEGRVLAPGYGYVKLRIFSSNTDAKLVEALEKIDAELKAGAGGGTPGARSGTGDGKLRGLILDLRRNPGGLLDQGVKVADRFLREGLIVRTVGKGGRELDRQIAHARGTWDGFPMVVLVDGATASAAEIVAGALQDHGRAVVLGQPTFGKGSVQTLLSLDGCGVKPCGLKITVSRYYTPSGRSIQNHGIIPNVQVAAQAPPRLDDEGPRERDFQRHLDNDEDAPPPPSTPPAALPPTDYQLQVALDYLRSFEIFARQR